MMWSRNQCQGGADRPLSIRPVRRSRQNSDCVIEHQVASTTAERRKTASLKNLSLCHRWGLRGPIRYGGVSVDWSSTTRLGSRPIICAHRHGVRERLRAHRTVSPGLSPRNFSSSRLVRRQTATVEALRRFASCDGPDLPGPRPAHADCGSDRPDRGERNQVSLTCMTSRPRCRAPRPTIGGTES